MLNFYDLLKNHEGAGDPDTLFAHAQKTTSPFSGVKVSEMNLGQLEDFASVDGSYGQWTKNKLGELGHKPRVATPMGIGQIVGTTLRQSAKELGLPDDTIFDEDTQRTIINHLARKRIDLNDRDATLKGLRNEWEGFKNVDDDTLWQAAHDVMGMEVDTSDLKRGKGADNFSTFQQDMRDNVQATKAALGNIGQEGPSNYKPMPQSLQAAYDARRPQLNGVNPLNLPRGGPMGGSSHPYGTQRAGAGVMGGSSNPLAAAQARATSPSTPRDAVSRAPTSPAGFPVGQASAQQPATQTPAAASAASPNQVEGGEAASDEQKQTFGDKLAAKLFPNAENPTERLKTTLGALSTGLSQMSHGQPVDLQPYFANIAHRKQQAQAAEAASALQQQEQANKDRNYQLEVAKHNRNLANDALNAYEAQFKNAGQPIPFSRDQLNEWIEGDDPTRKMAAEMIMSGNEHGVEKGIQMLKEYEMLEAEERAAKSSNPNMRRAINALSDPGASSDEVGAALEGMDSDEIQTALDVAGRDAASIQKPKLYKWALKNDPDLAYALEETTRMDRGIGESPREIAVREDADRLREAVNTDSKARRAATPQLSAMRGITHDLILEDIDTSQANGLAVSAVNILRQFGGGELAHTVEDYFGVDAVAFSRLENIDKTIMMLLAKPAMSNTGTLSDSDMRNMADTIARGDADNATRMYVLNKLETSLKLDKIIAESLEADMAGRYENDKNFIGVRRNHNKMSEEASAIAAELNRASDGITRMRYSDQSDLFYMPDMTKTARLNEISPELTPAQYATFKSAIRSVPAEYEGGKLVREAYTPWIRVNADGTRTYMINDDPINEKYLEGTVGDPRGEE